MVGLRNPEIGLSQVFIPMSEKAFILKIGQVSRMKISVAVNNAIDAVRKLTASYVLPFSTGC